MSMTVTTHLSTINNTSAGCTSTPSQLPIIDISPLYRRNITDRKRIAEAIAEAAADVGFFYIVGHPVSQQQIAGVYSQAERFFYQSLEVKNHYHIARSRNHRGYVPQSERGNYDDEQQRLYEAFDLALDLPSSRLNDTSGNCLVGPNVWPTLDGFRDEVYGYYRSVAAIGETLCRAFEIHLRLAPGYFRQFMKQPLSQLRLIHYLENNCPTDTANMQMGAHTDYEALTILHQRSGGLQVMDREGNWLTAPPIEGAYAVNIGDMMEAWTNGLFVATPHRVVNTGAERFSMPYFAAADFDATIEPVPGTVSSSRPSAYPAFKAGHHLLGQLVRDFGYLKRRYDAGQLPLPAIPTVSSQFERRLSAKAA